jgi:hypothetical protein
VSIRPLTQEQTRDAKVGTPSCGKPILALPPSLTPLNDSGIKATLLSLQAAFCTKRGWSATLQHKNEINEKDLSLSRLFCFCFVLRMRFDHVHEVRLGSKGC